MKKVFLFAVIAFVLFSCKSNELESEVKIYKIGNLTFSYYLSGSKANTYFAQGEWLIVHMDVKNEGEDTIMVNADYLGHLGLCYDSDNQLVESMSYINNDSLPVFKPAFQSTNARFSHAFLIDVSAGTYHFQNPRVVYYTKGNEADLKDITLPLTINFEVQ